MYWIVCDWQKQSIWRVLATFSLLLLGVMLVGRSTPVVRAHALLVRSIPEANTSLAQPPTAIDIWFSEPLESSFSGIRLLNSLGEEVPTGAVSLDPSDATHLTLPLGQLEPGIYTVAWQTLSQVDGHEWFGSFPFTVLNPDGSRPTGAAATVDAGSRGDLPSPGEVIARWLMLLGGMLLFGAPLFHLLIVPAGENPRRKSNALLDTLSRNLLLRAVWVAVLAIVLGSLLQVALQAVRIGGLEQLPDLLFGTRTGTLVLIRGLLAFTALFIILGLPQPWPLAGREWPLFWLTGISCIVAIILLFIGTTQVDRVLVLVTVTLAGLGMVLATLTPRHQGKQGVEKRTWQALLVLAGVLLLSISVGSHAGTVPGSVWAVLGDYVHLVAAAVWVGGLTLLPVLIWQLRQTETSIDNTQFLALVRRFSYLAGFAVFILIVTGLFNSLIELPTFASLFDTTYGYVLLAKLFAIAIALEIAFFNNRLVHHQTNQLKKETGLSHFNRQVALETFVGLGIMVGVAILVQTPAPRSVTQPTGAFVVNLPFNNIVQADDLYVHVQVSPNQVGNNRFWVHLYHADNSPIGETQLVRLTFEHQEAQLGQARADLEPLGKNTFAVEGAYMNQAGPWDLSVYVRRRGLDDVLGTISLDVPPPAPAETPSGPLVNPIPTLPSNLVIAGALLAFGAIPLIWRDPLQEFLGSKLPTIETSSWSISVAGLIGGVIVLGGLVMTLTSIPVLLARINPAGRQVPSSESSIAAGAELFQENCAVCHGVEGLGDGPRAADLRPPPASLKIHIPLHSDRELFGFIYEGLPNTAMPAFGDGLTNEEIWHLVNYLRDKFENDQDSISTNPVGLEPAPLVDKITFPGINGRLAFDSPDGKLWVVPANANPQHVPLFDLPERGFAFQPVWSPDGSQVAYGYLAPPEPNSIQKGALLWVANADGTPARAVVSYQENSEAGSPAPASYHDPTWSSDGQYIWAAMEFPMYDDQGFWVGLQSRIGKISVDTGEAEIIVEDGHSPDLSSDDEMLAYLVTNPETSRRQASESADGMARWFPDIFKPSPTLAHGLLPADVWLIDIDGTNLTRLTEQYEDYPTPTWSVDGRYIAFGGGKGLYLVEVQSGQIVRISDQAIDGQLDWSP